ncbi:hypothetical protein M404DRAFT_723773 [Pisolithus tinctorius Marx 270]|uniref:Uncharacterized protein n=1 Tax=Pisolithus tinctorius Marx 270 TaxID=870435 RepID=A0A0C3MXB4_PISTI|nr:hypothetical protein M404DRAFT_501027 [Pisolithus tinctorius Marx 270]KIO01728.1 hypothetical protein M404DRAFT_723773 [Pisolithus tinctorius Marx 270]
MELQVYMSIQFASGISSSRISISLPLGPSHVYSSPCCLVLCLIFMYVHVISPVVCRCMSDKTDLTVTPNQPSKLKRCHLPVPTSIAIESRCSSQTSTHHLSPTSQIPFVSNPQFVLRT